jgi:hypothetical protein
MRTVLYKIRLFNDKIDKQGDHIDMEQKEGEREQDSGETDRECVRQRGRVAVRGGNISCKNDR